MKKNIIITTSFIAIHNWPSCDIEEVLFLRFPHRHRFTVECKLEVKESREIEFIKLKQKLDTYLAQYYNEQDIGSMSCEDICIDIQNRFHFDYIKVMEDNENGAEVIV